MGKGGGQMEISYLHEGDHAEQNNNNKKTLVVYSLTGVLSE